MKSLLASYDRRVDVQVVLPAPGPMPVLDRLWEVGVSVAPVLVPQGGAGVAPGAVETGPAAFARRVAARLARLPPAASLILIGPPWWFGIAAQARCAVADSDPPLCILLPTPESAPDPSRRTVLLRAWLGARTQEAADWSGPVRPVTDVDLPPEAGADPRGWLASRCRSARTGVGAAARVSIGVVLVHRDRPRWAAQALASLARQTRPPDDLVVVDAASADPAARAAVRRAVAGFGVAPARVLECAQASLGAARTAGAAALTTDWVLFMDDDNLAPDDALATFAGAAATGAAAIWTCWAALFSGEPPSPGTDPATAPLYMPLGPVPGLLAEGNDLGDANLLIRRDAYMRLGGFDPDPAVGAEDWDLLVRAWLSGVPQRVIPRPLVWKRQSPDSMSATMDRARAHQRVRDRLRAAGLPL
ncbi:glycosyltransferase family 2 protein [Roseospira goensis]|uniref:GT2 family glycosyltransferase n=1 Tax=Roseospira goensis TaxID=391922 RepID=A0A7W6WJD5_9PROT|nr:glycosyltransferase [Roseospira goensis]MBB4284910.1 GT2 family glycosyltransferase [Roseospira goensis]